jgi:hypothetical protein
VLVGALGIDEGIHHLAQRNLNRADGDGGDRGRNQERKGGEQARRRRHE